MNFLLRILNDLILKAAAYFAAFFFGKQYEENKQNEKIIERVEKANKIRDRVRSDVEYRDRVRRMFDKSDL